MSTLHLTRVLFIVALWLVAAGSVETASGQSPGVYSIASDASLGYLNLRRGPNTSYPVVTQIPAGVGGIQISECGKRENSAQAPWCKAEWKGYSGWLSSCCIVADLTSASIPSEDTRSTQRALMWLGHYPGPLDGEIGPNTLAAIKQFQTTVRQNPTGSLTAAERVRLIADARAVEEELKYAITRDTRTGVIIGIPATLAPRIEPWSLGTKHTSPRSDFEVLLFSSNANLHSVFDQLKQRPGRRVWYAPLRDDWFVLAGVDSEGTKGETHIYARAHTEGSQVRGFVVHYAPHVHPRVGALITVMSSDLKPFPTPQEVAQAAPLSNPGRQDSRAAADLEPVRQSLNSFLDCLRQQDQAVQLRMPPEDYARVINGACGSSAGAFTKAFRNHAVRYQLGYDWATTRSEKTIADARAEAISAYTSKFYQAAAKADAPGNQSSNKEPSNKDKSFSSGSGIVVSNTGHVLTNAHVIDGCTIVQIRVPNRGYVPATVVAVNKDDDLAALKISADGLERASFRLGKPLRAGETIIVYGYPLQPLLASSGNISTGIVTALAGLVDNSRQLQISAPVQQGNSGGPLLDQAGNVVGVVVAKLSLKSVTILKEITQNVNFAIKAPIAAAFMDAHAIPYDTQSVDKTLAVPDIGERARQFAVSILCES